MLKVEKWSTSFNCAKWNYNLDATCKWEISHIKILYFTIQCDVPRLGLIAGCFYRSYSYTLDNFWLVLLDIEWTFNLNRWRLARSTFSGTSVCTQFPEAFISVWRGGDNEVHCSQEIANDGSDQKSISQHYLTLPLPQNYIISLHLSNCQKCI